MDERRLEQLLRDAVDDPPEPSFTVDDVAAASRRATARRRSFVAGAVAAVVFVGSAVGVVAAVSGDEAVVSTALAPAEEDVSGRISEKSSAEGQPSGDSERDHSAPGGPGVQNFPEVSPKQGGGTDGEDGPRAEGTSGCDTVDRELATALAGELPVDPIGEAIPYSPCFEADNRAAAYRVPGGTIAVVFDPGNARVFDVPHEVASATAVVGVSGGKLAVIGIAVDSKDEADVPLRDELPRIAERVAAVLD
ncbi:hypothetical protein [Saccharomonospora sp.]|uniref:hypothetical protein n=1 Tax=Saccharomonospora sp. TaxID=33913 RepID=UPI00261457BE|nr:hypothetical protein [Saccharomonospora sp.]